jgi:hypothetical protein
MKSLSQLVVASLATLLLASCGTGSSDLTMEVRLNYNGAPYTVGETVYKGDTALKFEKFYFYLSDVQLGDQLLEEVLFCNAEDSATMNYQWTLDQKATALTFAVGVDSLNNAMDPTSFEVGHPLSSANDMYWSWATKYRFLRIDGRLNGTGTLGTDDILLAWHTGKDALYRTVDLSSALSSPIKPGDHVILEFNLDALIAGMSLENESMTHTMVDDYEIAVKLSDNLPSAFSVRVE